MGIFVIDGFSKSVQRGYNRVKIQFKYANENTAKYQQCFGLFLCEVEPKHTANDERSNRKASSKSSKPNFQCFMCNRNHFAREC